MIGTPYSTVFEITQKSYQWWFPAVGLLIAAAGIVLLKLSRVLHWPGAHSRWRYFPIVFGAGWSLLVFISTYGEYHDLHRALRDGQYQVVEGRVEDFHPMPYGGHQNESFAVAGKTFSYSDYDVSAAFNNTASHGGPIRAGEQVRIACVGGNILRLEIRSDQVPSTFQRSMTAKSAAAKSAAEAAENPQLRKMNLAAGLVAIFMTAWWNLQWRRFLKFWVRPPNRRATIIGFRVFFAVNLIGSVWWMASELVRRPETREVYFGALKLGAVLIAVVILMVTFGEWQYQRRTRQDNAR